MREGGIALWSLGRGLAPYALSVLFASAVFPACGGDPGDVDSGARGDAGVDAATPDGGAEAPAPPMPPSFAPCPPGTVEEPREGAPTECWPVSEPGCTGDEVRYLGETACSSVGSPCAAGDFPDDVEASAVYVLAEATGGDGTRAAPFATVAEGLAGAGLGRTVVVGAGTYDEILSIRQSVTLRGVCAAETILTSSAPDNVDAIVNITRGTVALRDLSLRNARRGGIVATGSGAHATFEGVLVDGTAAYGVYVDQSADATIDGLVVRGVATAPSGGLFGSGLVVATGGEVTASRVVIEGTHSSGVDVLDEGTLTAERLTIRDIEVDGRGAGGRGLSVKSASVVDVDQLWIERTREIAVEARDADTRVTIRRGFIAETLLDPPGLSSRPLSCFGGAEAALHQVAIAGFGDVGLFISDGCRAVAEDLVVRDARGQGDGDYGRFVAVQGGTFEGRRLHLEDGGDVGVAIDGAGSRAVIEDLVISRLTGRPADDLLGRGITLQFDAALELRRALILDTRNVALFAEASTLEVEDVDIRRVTPAPETRRGRGVNLQGGTVASLARVSIDDSYDLGLFAGGAGTEVSAAGLTIRRVVSPPCSTGESCPVDPGGIGVGVYDYGRCTVTDIVVSEAALCGVHVAEGGELDLAGGRISDSTIGACVQVEGYDVGRLDSVRFEGNGTSLEATSLPVPQGSMSIER